MQALDLGEAEIVSVLLQNGATANDVFDGSTMLMLAANVRNIPIFEDFAIKDIFLRFLKVRSEKVTRALLLKGADPNFQNRDGTALHAAIEGDNEEMVKVLISESEVSPKQPKSRKLTKV